MLYQEVSHSHYCTYMSVCFGTSVDFCPKLVIIFTAGLPVELKENLRRDSSTMPRKSLSASQEDVLYLWKCVTLVPGNNGEVKVSSDSAIFFFFSLLLWPFCHFTVLVNRLHDNRKVK